MAKNVMYRLSLKYGNNDQQYRESGGGDSNMCIRDAMLAYVGPLQQDSVGSESTEHRSESVCVLN